MLGELLDAPLIVRVTDGRGVGIAGVPVSWTSGDGSALTCQFSEFFCQRESRIVHTDAAGHSSVLARPAELYRGTVTAAVAATPTLSITFSMDPLGALIRAEPLVDCIDKSDPVRFSGHEGASHTFVPVGTLVEFEVAKCVARIVTTNAPAGDAGFDSGDLSPGQRFRFVPKVAGTWEFTDEYSRGVGRLTASPLPTHPGFPPLSRSATVYNETVPLYDDAVYRLSVTRFVFFDDGTFQLQFSTQRHGWFTYRGSYSTTESTTTLDFEGAGPAGKWVATASVSGDTLTVNYNHLMQMDDFINGRYIRAH